MCVVNKPKDDRVRAEVSYGIFESQLPEVIVHVTSINFDGSGWDGVGTTASFQSQQH